MADDITPTLIASIADLIEADLVTLQEVITEHEWNPADASAAQADLETTVIRRAREWGRPPVRTLHTFLSMSWMSLIDHVRSSAALLRADVSFGSMVAARSAAEAVGRVSWLLAADLGVEERVERSMAVRVRSLKDALRALDTLVRDAGSTERPRLDEMHQQARDRMTEVLTQARRMGFDVHRGAPDPGQKKGPVIGMRLAPPGSTELTVRGLHLPGDVGLGVVVELWSGVTHSVPWAIGEFRERIGRLDDDTEIVVISTGLWQRAQAAVLAHDSAIGCFRLLAEYFGWSVEHVATAFTERSATWREVRKALTPA